MHHPYEQRVARLREKLTDGPYDTLMVLVEENRRYLSGFTGEDTQFDETAGCLFVTPDRLLIATDSRYTTQAVTEAPQCEVYTYRHGLAKALAGICSQLDIREVGFEAVRVSVREYDRMVEELEKAGSDVTLYRSHGLVEGLREIKDEAEVEAVQRSLALVEGVFRSVLDGVEPGMREKDVAWNLERAMREAGAERLSFPCIVAAGTNAAKPHAIPGEDRVTEGKPLLFDWGAVLEGYCSDISRTVCIGQPDDMYKEVRDTVLEAQQKAMAAAGPGMPANLVDKIARDVINKAGFEGRFGHGLGHGVGLAVHEAPSVGPTRDTKLEPGMIFTVEPGVYLPEWGGVRIENMVVVRENGVEVLNSLPENMD
ncbi:MAG: aminopeptidase P family protein [Desulfatibacillaceae bacterium]